MHTQQRHHSEPDCLVGPDQLAGVAAAWRRVGVFGVRVHAWGGRAFVRGSHTGPTMDMTQAVEVELRRDVDLGAARLAFGCVP